jgi:hypothetical protein
MTTIDVEYINNVMKSLEFAKENIESNKLANIALKNERESKVELLGDKQRVYQLKKKVLDALIEEISGIEKSIADTDLKIATIEKQSNIADDSLFFRLMGTNKRIKLITIEEDEEKLNDITTHVTSNIISQEQVTQEQVGIQRCEPIQEQVNIQRNEPTINESIEKENIYTSPQKENIQKTIVEKVAIKSIGEKLVSKPNGEKPKISGEVCKTSVDKPVSKPHGDKPLIKKTEDKPVSKPHGDKPLIKKTEDKPVSKLSGEKPKQSIEELHKKKNTVKLAKRKGTSSESNSEDDEEYDNYQKPTIKKVEKKELGSNIVYTRQIDILDRFFEAEDSLFGGHH